jgi:hypothetical protein
MPPRRKAVPGKRAARPVAAPHPSRESSKEQPDDETAEEARPQRGDRGERVSALICEAFPSLYPVTSAPASEGSAGQPVWWSAEPSPEATADTLLRRTAPAAPTSVQQRRTTATHADGDFKGPAPPLLEEVAKAHNSLVEKLGTYRSLLHSLTAGAEKPPVAREPSTLLVSAEQIISTTVGPLPVTPFGGAASPTTPLLREPKREAQPRTSYAAQAIASASPSVIPAQRPRQGIVAPQAHQARGEELLEISPRSVFVTDYVGGESQTIRLTIQNRHTSGQHLKLVQPADSDGDSASEFVLEEIVFPQSVAGAADGFGGFLGPGMTAFVSIKFVSRDAKQHHQRLRVRSKACDLQVDLTARVEPPLPLLESVGLPMALVGLSAETSVRIQNGGGTGVLRLECDDPGVRFSHNSFESKRGDMHDLRVSAVALQEGKFDAHLRIVGVSSDTTTPTTELNVPVHGQFAQPRVESEVLSAIRTPDGFAVGETVSRTLAVRSECDVSFPFHWTILPVDGASVAPWDRIAEEDGRSQHRGELSELVSRSISIEPSSGTFSPRATQEFVCNVVGTRIGDADFRAVLTWTQGNARAGKVPELCRVDGSLSCAPRSAVLAPGGIFLSRLPVGLAVREVVEIKNYSDSEARFSWSRPESEQVSCEIVPQNARVAARGTARCLVTLKGLQQGHVSMNARCTFEFGPTLTMPILVSEVFAQSLSVEPSDVFVRFPERSSSIELTNRTPLPIEWSLEDNQGDDGPLFLATPSHGMILPRESTSVVLEVNDEVARSRSRSSLGLRQLFAGNTIVSPIHARFDSTLQRRTPRLEVSSDASAIAMQVGEQVHLDVKLRNRGELEVSAEVVELRDLKRGEVLSELQVERNDRNLVVKPQSTVTTRIVLTAVRPYEGNVVVPFRVVRRADQVTVAAGCTLAIKAEEPKVLVKCVGHGDDRGGEAESGWIELGSPTGPVLGPVATRSVDTFDLQIRNNTYGRMKMNAELFVRWSSAGNPWLEKHPRAPCVLSWANNGAAKSEFEAQAHSTVNLALRCEGLFPWGEDAPAPWMLRIRATSDVGVSFDDVVPLNVVVCGSPLEVVPFPEPKGRTVRAECQFHVQPGSDHVDTRQFSLRNTSAFDMEFGWSLIEGEGHDPSTALSSPVPTESDASAASQRSELLRAGAPAVPFLRITPETGLLPAFSTERITLRLDPSNIHASSSSSSSPGMEPGGRLRLEASLAARITRGVRMNLRELPVAAHLGVAAAAETSLLSNSEEAVPVHIVFQ